MIITNSSADDHHLKQLSCMLTSMRINSPGYDVHVFLANCPKNKEKMLKKKFPEIIFENTELVIIDKMGFSFIQFRAKLIKECFENYNEHVAWIDTDVIIRKDLSEFLDIKPTQLKILYRGKEAPEKVKINAGIFNIGCSEETYNFICNWKKRIEINAKWGMGQLEFWRAYKEHKNEIELIKMLEKFNDLGGNDRPNAFDTGSVMWHCKKNHFNKYMI